MKNLHTIPSCENCSITFGSVFRHLQSDDIDLVNFEKACNFYKRGDIVYHEGSRINGFYCINKGALKLYKTGFEGREQIIRFAKQGDLIGYRSILSGELSCSTAKVIDDAVLCFIPSRMLFDLVKRNINFSMELMQRISKELGVANAFILDIAQKTVRERLAEVLLLLKNTFGLDKEGVLQVSLTREEIANIVGTATESVIRLLSEFKSDKLIALERRKIKILNTKGLTKIANVFA